MKNTTYLITKSQISATGLVVFILLLLMKLVFCEVPRGKSDRRAFLFLGEKKRIVPPSEVTRGYCLAGKAVEIPHRFLPRPFFINN